MLVFWFSSSEANDLALQIAQRVTGSIEVIVLQGFVNCHMFHNMIYFFTSKVVHSLVYSLYVYVANVPTRLHKKLNTVKFHSRIITHTCSFTFHIFCVFTYCATERLLMNMTNICTLALGVEPVVCNNIAYTCTHYVLLTYLLKFIIEH